MLVGKTRSRDWVIRTAAHTDLDPQDFLVTTKLTEKNFRYLLIGLEKDDNSTSLKNC